MWSIIRNQLFDLFVDHFQNYNFDNCIKLLSLFRSGTTWVQEIVCQILNEGEVDSKTLPERVPFLEMLTHPSSANLDINTLPSPRIFKTHLTYQATPKSANEDTKCKYIYVARNPKDVAVSYFKFETSLKHFGSGYNGPWEFFAKLFIEGNGKLVQESILSLLVSAD